MELPKGFNTLALGTLTPGAAVTRTLGFARDTSNPAFIKNFYVKLEALARDGKAEVLARPSVLTLDNRQATIRGYRYLSLPVVIRPPQQSRGCPRSFFYMPTGIQLNVRPRIDNEGRGRCKPTPQCPRRSRIRACRFVVRRSGAGCRPGVSTRLVQTYARYP